MDTGNGGWDVVLLVRVVHGAKGGGVHYDVEVLCGADDGGDEREYPFGDCEGGWGDDDVAGKFGDGDYELESLVSQGSYTNWEN